jgi:hypothetical protein
MPQPFMLEKQPRGEGHSRDVCLGIERKLRRIEVEIREARQRTQFVPFVILITSRHECELAREPPERRSSQAFDERLPVASRAILVHHEQVNWRVETVFDSGAARALNGFSRHAVARNGAASHEIGRTNLYGGMGDDHPNTTGRPRRPIVFGWTFAAVIHRGEPTRANHAFDLQAPGPKWAKGTEDMHSLEAGFVMAVIMLWSFFDLKLHQTG